MKFGPKYKIARRLGPNVFDKTETQKFALKAKMRDMKKSKGKSRPKAKSDFGLQLLEKQKAKVTYGISERKFSNYVKNILSKKGENNHDVLVQDLEMRLDNVIYRMGFVKSRQASRQMVSHGHINVNGKRVNVPSFKVSIGDIITIRERSKTKPLFKNLDEEIKAHTLPSWIGLDIPKREAKIQGIPKIAPSELKFDISAIFQYYSR
ncbi:MAG: 30S ribosomal protein S4 [Minisyncoccia bacterium]